MVMKYGNNAHGSAASPAPRLGATHTVPAASGYDFEEVFHGGFGRAGFENEEHHIKQFEQPLMDEAVKLDEAKRAAAKAVNELISVQNQFPRDEAGQGDPEEWLEPHEAAVLAERVVVKCRIAMLNRMLKDSETNLVMQVGRVGNGSEEPTSQVFTSVQYRRLQTAGVNTKTFALQTPQVWLSLWPWVLTQNLFTTEDHENMLHQQLNQTVATILVAATKTVATRELRTLFSSLLGETFGALTLNFSSSLCNPDQMTDFRKWQTSESYNEGIIVHTAESFHLYNGFRIKVEVIIGALRINYCDQWHNPLINEFTQKAVLRSAQDSVFNRLTTDNSVKITVVVSHMGAIHVLDLAPAISPDTCCVKHLHISDESGILALTDRQISDIEVPETKSSAYRWYYCPGAHRNQRLNEQQLNAIHAAAFRIQSRDMGVHRLETENLPNPNNLITSETPAAKSARISFTDYDVLITSYATPHTHEGHQCKTAITLVRYPPFGMQYQKEHKPPPPPQVIIKEVHVPVNNGGQQTQALPKRNPFKDPPPDGVMQYIIWYSADADNSWAINLVDHDESRAETLEMMEYGKETNKEIWNAFKDTGHWMSPGKKEMVTNIIHNDNLDTHGRKVRDIYRNSWRRYIVRFIRDLEEVGGGFNENEDFAYLYCKKPEVWDEFADDLGENTIEAYKAYSEARYKRDTDSQKLDKRGIRGQVPTAGPGEGGARYLGATPALPPPPPGKIAIPGGARQQQATTPVAVLALVQQMKERIHALEEAKTGDARAEGNTEHLLRQVLNTLARPGSAAN